MNLTNNQRASEKKSHQHKGTQRSFPASRTMCSCREPQKVANECLDTLPLLTHLPAQIKVDLLHQKIISSTASIHKNHAQMNLALGLIFDLIVAPWASVTE